MHVRLLGWPEDAPRLDLDHEDFAYAGNFRTGRTGLAVAEAVDGRSDTDDSNDEASDDPTVESDTGAASADDVVAAISFDDDRAVADALRIRYVSVRSDRRGEGIGPRLVRFVVERARERGYERVRIGVNNPIAYRALYRAGFGFTGEESGMGELVLEAPPPDDRSVERYRAGYRRFAGRELPRDQRAVLERHRDGMPPAVVDSP